MGLLKGAATFFNHCFYRNIPTSYCKLRMRAWTSLSLIFLGRPLLQWTLSTCERWLLVLSHIRATDDLEISHFHAILRSDSPLFSLRNQTLARCSAEIMAVYTITYCETVCSCNGLTVNLVYSLKYSMRNYATKPVLSYDEFTKVVFRLQRKVRYKTPASSKPAPPCMITHLKTPPKKTFLGWGTNSDNHGQKCWDSCTVWTLFNTCEIVSSRY